MRLARTDEHDEGEKAFQEREESDTPGLKRRNKYAAQQNAKAENDLMVFRLLHNSFSKVVDFYIIYRHGDSLSRCIMSSRSIQ